MPALKHRGERRLKGLVERREEEWRVGRGAPVVGAVGPTDGFLPDDHPVAHDGECGGGGGLASHPLAEDAAGLAKVRRALGGKRGRNRDGDDQCNEGSAHVGPYGR